MKFLADGRLLVILVTVAMLGAVVTGLIVTGSPASQRARRFDEQRSRNLMAIANAIDGSWSRTPVLPKDLKELAQASDTRIELADPETRQPYEYRIVSPTSYELCAQFARPSDESEYAWTHGSGRHCFSMQPRRRETSPRP